ncbi:MAG: acyltransferase [Phycisphaerae bacterium]|nr:acyltransferase [Phycisphaerae bacterium]
MGEGLKQCIRLSQGIFRRLRRWKYGWNRWVTWPQRVTRKLTLAPKVRLYVPLRCDGDGHVEIAEGSKMGGRNSVRYGDGTILLQARDPKSHIRIGKNCAFSNNVSIISMESVEIGDDCLIGELVSIMDSDFHGIDSDKRRSDFVHSAPVKLENNVWLGSRVIVQKGVTIGANSIITPNAVVTSSVPPNTIAGGIPAKVIRSIVRDSG